MKHLSFNSKNGSCRLDPKKHNGYKSTIISSSNGKDKKRKTKKNTANNNNNNRITRRKITEKKRYINKKLAQTRTWKRHMQWDKKQGTSSHKTSPRRYRHPSSNYHQGGNLTKKNQQLQQ